MGAANLSHKHNTHLDMRDDPSKIVQSKPHKGGIKFDIIHSREEAEGLIHKDHAQTVQNHEWTCCFVESMVQYLLWQKTPSGKISDMDMAWLLGRVLDQPSPSMPALLLALLREMNAPPMHLISLAMRVLGVDKKQIIPQFSATHPILTQPPTPPAYTA